MVVLIWMTFQTPPKACAGGVDIVYATLQCERGRQIGNFTPIKFVAPSDLLAPWLQIGAFDLFAGAKGCAKGWNTHNVPAWRSSRLIPQRHCGCPGGQPLGGRLLAGKGNAVPSLGM